MKTFTPGGIRCPEAMAQGKMLDHSWWGGKMARNITPSDIDAVVESYGCVLWWELTRNAETIDDISKGQRILMRALMAFPGVHAVAILQHGIMSHSKPINTATDIQTATIYYDKGTRIAKLDNAEWCDFAIAWTYNASAAVTKHLRSKDQ